MKKREKKLQLHRETVRRLDPQGIAAEDLGRAVGGTEVGVVTSCIRPNCCPTTDTGTATE